MNPAEVMSVLEQHDAILRGHFKLASGRHSDIYVQKFRAFEHPRLTQSLGEAIANLFEREFDLVASPAFGAVVLGFAASLAAETRVIFAERVEGSMTFRRGFKVIPHERVLVVEDVITTGGSAREVVELVRSAGGKPVGIGCLLDRTEAGAVTRFGVPLKALARLEAPTWTERECPLCEQKVVLEEPGSSRLS